ncbi:hypothetical protein HAX54_011010 [Datura stramonium]|uniref:Uncharacterized protein n=1 Tax=Datura stramonium TaxID=4076 RepID=A0ABS8X0B4_DATST|nr:hypothetical protein [Datura stramonium]
MRKGKKPIVNKASVESGRDLRLRGGAKRGREERRLWWFHQRGERKREEMEKAWVDGIWVRVVFRPIVAGINGGNGDMKGSKVDVGCFSGGFQRPAMERREREGGVKPQRGRNENGS